MALKMKELTELTGESKSTILYYVKEGLLPEPQKPKPNVHLYDESSVQIVKFIKYLQNSFSYSISQIKSIFENNNFNFDNSFDAILDAIRALEGGNMVLLSSNEVKKELNLEEGELESYIKRAYILDKSKFNYKDIEAIKILHNAKELGLDFKLFDLYAKNAQLIAKDEHKIGFDFLKDDSTTHNLRYQLLFDIILNYKPYIFNSYTINEHKKGIK